MCVLIYVCKNVILIYRYLYTYYLSSLYTISPDNNWSICSYNSYLQNTHLNTRMHLSKYMSHMHSYIYKHVHKNYCKDEYNN